MEKSIVVIGGGTGTFTVLSGLKKYPVRLSAIVAMSDSGGSTGVLRDEYGVLPPGDLRQCLVALSEADTYMRDLFNYRFANGGLKGHNFGNIFISTLEQVTGSFDKAVACASDILKINGTVVPVTLNDVHVVTELKNSAVLHGEHELSECQDISTCGIHTMRLVPTAKANPKALKAIAHADLIVVGPGNFYASLIPNLLVGGIGRALHASRAQKVFVVNLMNKHGQTDGFTVGDYVDTIERFAGTKKLFDTVLYNTKLPPARLLKKYVDEGEPVKRGSATALTDRKVLGRHLLSHELYTPLAGDALKRTLIRHDAHKLAKVLMQLV